MAGLMLGLVLQIAMADIPAESSTAQEPTNTSTATENSARAAKAAEDKAKQAELVAAELRATAKKKAEEAAKAAEAFAKEKTTEAAAATAAAKAANVTASGSNIADETLQSKLSDWGFSAGLAAMMMSGAREVKGATNANGILQVDYEPSQRIGFILEAHYFLGLRPLGSPKQKKDSAGQRMLGTSKREQNERLLEQYNHLERTDFAFGPSVCVEAGSNGFKSAGLGGMVSFRRCEITKTSAGYDAKIVGRPFNLGIYYMIEPRVQTLASGLVEGQPLPANTPIRFEDKSRNGVAVVFSVSL